MVRLSREFDEGGAYVTEVSRGLTLKERTTGTQKKKKKTRKDHHRQRVPPLVFSESHYRKMVSWLRN